MPLNIAQITDSHLFSDTAALHLGVNVYQNLKCVLNALANQPMLDAIVFTGDLTQDHSEGSYQRFAELVKESGLSAPFYFLAGNHDEPTLLAKHLTGTPFNEQKNFGNQHWQVFLVDTKSETPAGFVNLDDLAHIKTQIEQEEGCNTANTKHKYQWFFQHHHPIDVGYFIDRHHLTNQTQYWQYLSSFEQLKGICCGHVHQGITLPKADTGMHCDVLTCPATSIQFDPDADTVAALPLGPGYRLISLLDDGNYISDLCYLKPGT